MTKIRVALAQIQPSSAPERTSLDDDIVAGDPFPTLKANLEQIEQYVKQAKKAGAEIAVFPEYLQGILNEDRQYLSLPSSQYEACIASLAKKYEIGISGSIVHGRPRSTMSTTFPSPPSICPFTDSNGPKQWSDYLRENRDTILSHVDQIALENEAFLLDTTGEMCGNYIKRNLWHPEREYLSPGKPKGEVFDTPWGKIGFLICWDLSHPAAAQRLVDQGADMILAPTYWLATDSEPMLSRHNKDPDYEYKIVQSLALSRAFESELFLVMVNAGGSRDEGFMGGSGVWAPLLGRVAGFDGPQVGVKVVEVDLGILKDARETYKIREDWADKELR